MSKKRRAKIPPFRVLNSENIFRKFVSKIMRSCDKNFAQLHVAHSVTGVTNELTEKIEKLPIKEQKKIIKVIHTLLEE